MRNPRDHSERKESKRVDDADSHTPAAGVRNQLHCSDGVLKEIVFTPLNYIQTFKIQIYFFFLRNVGHAFLPHLHMLREALELRVTQQTWQDPKCKYATALKTSIIEKQRNTK